MIKNRVEKVQSQFPTLTSDNAADFTVVICDYITGIYQLDRELGNTILDHCLAVQDVAAPAQDAAAA